jgi:dolichyl-phosphate beta-glucosyltransferase
MNDTVSDLQRVSSWIHDHQGNSTTIDLSIVVPAYNEERRLPPTLIDMIDFCEENYPSYEIIVVDDGSSDKTSSTVQKFAKVRPTVRLIRLPRNQGKGHAVRPGVLSSRGDYVLFADADGATPISELSRLMTAAKTGSDVVIGSRAKQSDETKVSTVIHRKILGRVFNKVVNLLLLPGIADTQCGFKLFTKRAAAYLFSQQQSDRFSFDVELLFLAQQVKLTLTEVPINWTNVPGSKVNLVLDAIAMFRDILRFKVIHRGVSADSLKRFEAEQSALLEN